MLEVLLKATTSNLVRLNHITHDQVASAFIFTYITIADKGGLAHYLPSRAWCRVRGR